MLFIYYVLLPAASLLCGAVIAWQLNNHLARKARLGFVARMTRQVQERYQAYVVLETRVKQVIEQFGEREREFNERLTAQKAQIRELTRALDEYNGQSGEEEDAAADPEGLELVTFRPTESGERNLAAELSEWEARLEQVQANKRAELERQSRIIAELTDRI